MKPGFKLEKVIFKLKEGNKSTDDLFKDKRVVLFGLPGAFIPSCSSQQLPEFENNCERFKKLGIDEVYCCSVNDAYIMKAWSEKIQIKNIKLIKEPHFPFRLCEHEQLLEDLG